MYLHTPPSIKLIAILQPEIFAFLFYLNNQWVQSPPTKLIKKLLEYQYTNIDKIIEYVPHFYFQANLW